MTEPSKDAMELLEALAATRPGMPRDQRARMIDRAIAEELRKSDKLLAKFLCERSVSHAGVFYYPQLIAEFRKQEEAGK